MSLSISVLSLAGLANCLEKRKRVGGTMLNERRETMDQEML
jgi:hypothetical protein